MAKLNSGTRIYGNVTVDTFVTATGNVIGGNVLTAGLISATGNITGGNILGGANVNATTHTGTTVSVTANITGGNLLTAGLISATSTITSAANIIGGNITTTGLVTATGNITGGNIRTAGVVSATANITGGNLLTAGLISATGNVTGGNILGGANVNATTHTGTTVSVTANITGGNLLTGGLISATGNITGGNILGGANVNATTHTGTTVSVTANITGGNVLTAGVVSATGNVAGNFFIGNGSLLTGISGGGTPSSIVNGTSNVVAAASGNVSVGVAGTANVAVFATTGAYITGLISASGNIIGGNVISSGVRVYKWTTQANTAPSNPVPGDNWYDSYADKLYLYINDGTGNQWVDQSFPTTFASLTVTGNTSSGNILTAGLISATGNILGNVFTVNLGNTANAIINGGANGVGNIGTATSYFNTVFGKATTAQYADLAEMYSADAEYAPGTVLDFGGNQEVTLSTAAASNRVAGVVSTNPAHLMNSVLTSEYPVAVALTGRVPTSVTGTVRKGDMMVSSGNGFAQASATPAMGTVIGKALQNFDGLSGVIEIVVGRL